jgi:D-alanyl-lipoteichoic acid acyltransferase DltB (MBOAT superfamily)
MLFNSIQFAWFLPLVFGLFVLSPHSWRIPILLLASCYFYAAFIPKYLFILLAVVLLDYFAGIFIEAFSRKRLILIASLVGNIGILAVFKYYNFFVDNVAALAEVLHWQYPVHYLTWALPIGLSFHTFQSMSYTIEVYRGNQKAERNFFVYALYVLYFPQMVAGPIERPQNILPQLRRRWRFSYADSRSGMQLIARGLIKKCVIADTLAIMVNQAYASPSTHSGASLLLASLFFSWQIFCDFSGYTDIARGVSRLFGIEMMVNFNKPYLAQSFSDFWRRWHISLSTWFRDYVYIPLGGNRRGPLRHSFNLLVVFLVSGLWHGASWTFVIWGAIHWALLTAEFVSPRWNLPAAIKGLSVFAAVTLAWVFFRATSLSEAKEILTRIATWQPGTESVVQSVHFSTGVLAICALLALQIADRKLDLPATLAQWSFPARWAVYASIVFTFYLFGQFSSNHFIYFQF